MLATFAGVFAIVADLLWAITEALKAWFGLDLFIITYPILIIVFPLCIWMALKSAQRYLRNGYIRKEMVDEKDHKKQVKQSQNFGKLTKVIENKENSEF